MRKKILIGLAVALLLMAGGCVTLVGPWPTYSSSFHGTGYFRRTMAAIDENVKQSKISRTSGSLSAGWGQADMTPPAGSPLAGYGAREGKPSTGLRASEDEPCFCRERRLATGLRGGLSVKALCLSDSEDLVVIVSADMLLVPRNVADRVRADVGKKTPLTPSGILFNATHTHSGPGGWGEDYVGRFLAGTYDPKIVDLLVQAFSDAIVEAYLALEPAGLYHGSVDAGEFIVNRARRGPTDSELDYMAVRQDDGDTCHVVRFSAHPTVLSRNNREFSGDYPSYLEDRMEAEANTMTMFLGGAVGSMGPNPPTAQDAFTEARAMGEALADRVLAQPPQPFAKDLDIVSIGISLELPPLQVRLNPAWRLSPFFVRLFGIDRASWLQAVRVGDAVFVGAPYDLSGEIGAELKRWGATKGLHLWNLSFNGDYAGHISPDKYYPNTNKDEQYELYLMSWYGPHQEAYLTTLIRHMTEVMGPAASKAL